MASVTRPRPPHPPVSTGPVGFKTLWLTSNQAMTQLISKVTMQIPVSCSLQTCIALAGQPHQPACLFLAAVFCTSALIFVWGIVAQATFQHARCLPVAVHWRCQTAGCPLCPLLPLMLHPLLSSAATTCQHSHSECGMCPRCSCVLEQFVHCGCHIPDEQDLLLCSAGHHHPEELPAGLLG